MLANLLVNKDIEITEAAVYVSHVSDIIRKNQLSVYTKSEWFGYLDRSSTKNFLLSLPSHESRVEWAEGVFKVIEYTGYSFLDMFLQRLHSQPYQILFQDMSGSVPVRWSYDQVYKRIRETAAVIYKLVPDAPRVAIWANNEYLTAVADLACLMFDIFDTPLNVHFSTDNVQSIFEALGINVVITDSKNRIEQLRRIKQNTGLEFQIVSIREDIGKDLGDVVLLSQTAAAMSLAEVETTLSQRKCKPIDQVATTMFTSGSTGLPKGVSFSIYNLVTKRFARHAAVPYNGEHEVMLCYLPLFHTFGRFLELQGAIYWRGTYVFTGNPSAETLITQFAQVNPSIFISIPLRWQQLYDKAIARIADNPDADPKELVREITGRRLHWGLSAAGYLPPSVFQFFQKHGIELCSGFGMTEATGGITMTPPGDYSANSVGKPLPGMRLQLTEIGELLIGGHYVTRYLEEAGPDDRIPFPHEEAYWLPTGDIFSIDNGHYQIIDRVKDIYKNNKGQTIAPRITEKEFADVPGIKRVFLVGDARPYNVLLIVPDENDEIVAHESSENLREYFHRIIMEANRKLAPYERVVNFRLLDRDFDIDKSELTPKGTINRKVVTTNFATEIDELYVSERIVLTCNDIKVIIPRWFFRDLGILEDDIIVQHGVLHNRRLLQDLVIRRGKNDHVFQVGDLKYTIKTDIIDLGLFSRQPRLWVGNPSLIDFSPVKEGWDLPLRNVSSQVILPLNPTLIYNKNQMPGMLSIRDPHLLFINEMICSSLHTLGNSAIQSTKQIGDSFNEYDEKLLNVIRRRLEALSRHPEEDVRALAYRILLLQDPKPDYTKLFPTFIQSGLSFLNEDSIRILANYDMGKQHLESLRQRLYSYRTQLEWPADETTRNQFENILKLLFNFASQHILDYFSTIRAEFANWILHKQDPYLSEIARNYFDQLSEIFENHLAQTSPPSPIAEWEKRIVFDERISTAEMSELKKVFVNTRFLKKTVLLAYNETDINLLEIPERGIWVTKIGSVRDFDHYRISLNTVHGKHFDLHFMLAPVLRTPHGMETVYWHAAIASHPYASNSLPGLGCHSVQYGALATRFVSDLNVSEKIRGFAGLHNSLGFLRKPSEMRKLYVKGMSEIFNVWHHSGYRIVPGNITPSNVVVPELDYLDSAILISIAGHHPYTQPSDLFEPLVVNFFTKVVAFYPWVRYQIQLSWVFDAAREVLNPAVVANLLEKLHEELKQKDVCYLDESLLEALEIHLQSAAKQFYVPLPLFNAIDKYDEWRQLNPMATYAAKEETIWELADLYKLHNLPEIGRFYMYRMTYFAETTPEIAEAFDLLLHKMNLAPSTQATRFIELSLLQEAIGSSEDLQVFSKMVFPRMQQRERFDILKIGAKQKEEIIVLSYISDKKGNIYTMRAPIEAREIGQLYHLFYEENYPKSISEMDQHFVVLDSQDRVIGGLCYIPLDHHVVLLDGAAVSHQLKGRGIGSAMIEAFSTRMSALGIVAIKAHFLRGNFYLKLNFKVDKKWGALVKFLS